MCVALTPAAVSQLAYHFSLALSLSRCLPFSWDSIFKMHLHSALINDIRTVFNVHRNRINILLAVVSFFPSLFACICMQFHAKIVCTLRTSCVHSDLWDIYKQQHTQQVWVGKHAPSRWFGLPFCHCFDFWGFEPLLGFLRRISLLHSISIVEIKFAQDILTAMYLKWMFAFWVWRNGGQNVSVSNVSIQPNWSDQIGFAMINCYKSSSRSFCQ